MPERLNGPNLPTRVASRLWGWTHRFDATGTKRDRATQLLVTVCASVAVLAGLDLLTGSGLYENLFFPDLEKTAQVQAWSARVYAAIFTVGLPVAFLLWHWRDRNTRDQIENARKDINLKEFQEVQLRAAGGLDTNVPEAAREQLQIAALHQLRGFLRGEYGQSFRRPAFELLLAGHAGAVERIGLKKTIEVFRKISPRSGPATISESLNGLIENAFQKWRSVDRERCRIIRDEWQSLFLQEFPLFGRNFDGIELPENADLSDLKLNGCSFIGARLYRVKFRDSDLSKTHFEGANVSSAIFEGASMWGSNFEGANLVQANLECASLFGARMSGSSLREANLSGAALRYANLVEADFFQANLNRTKLNGANLEKADFCQAHIEGADFSCETILDPKSHGETNWLKAKFDGSIFDDETILVRHETEAGHEDREEADSYIRQLGGVHVRDVTVK